MDILDEIDAATDEQCACGCGCPLPPDGASAYFATPECQRRWNERNTTNPHAVRGSFGVEPDPARWRPDLTLTDVDDHPPRLATEVAAVYQGSMFATAYHHDDRPGWHLRLHDGNRFVGLGLDPTGDEEEDQRRIAATWERLERELSDSRRVVDSDGWIVSVGTSGAYWPLTEPQEARWRDLGAEDRANYERAYAVGDRGTLTFSGFNWVGHVTQVTINGQTFAVDPQSLAHAVRPIGDAIRSLGERLTEAVQPVADVAHRCGLVPEEPPEDPMERALWLRRNRNTGPNQRQRAPRRIDPRRAR